MTFPFEPVHFPHDKASIQRLRHRWGWIVLLGALVSLLGFAAIVLYVSSTVASVYLIAFFMIMSGGAEIALGVSARDWAHFFLWIVAGLFYIIAGAFALAQPFVAAAIFTLMIGFALIIAGAVRIYFGTRLAKPVRGTVILAGAVTVLVGLLVVFGWPVNSLFILGTLLGLDLMFWGTSWIAFGLRLRSIGHHAA